MTKLTFRHLLALTASCLALSAVAAPKHAHGPVPAQPVVLPASAPVQAPDLRGTPEHPILVAVAPDKGKESDDHTLANWTVALGVATIVLAVIGGLQLWLVRRQLKVMEAGGKDTELAAKAANKASLAAEKSANVAEKSLYDTERPFVTGEVPIPGLTVFAGDVNGPHLKREHLTISINNYGRTPAILTELHYRIDHVDHGADFPPIDPDGMRGRLLPSGVLAVAGKPFEERENLAMWELPFERGIASNQRAVWVVGFVRYRDVFGKTFVTGFAHVFDPFHNVFVRRGDELRNYTREEKESGQFELPDHP